MKITYVNIDNAIKSIRSQIIDILGSGKPADVIVKEYKKVRTNQQNKWLWEVYNHMSRFFDETGFVVKVFSRLPCVLSDTPYLPGEMLHAYYKMLLGHRTTTNLSTKEFGEYVEKIQIDWITESKGNYQGLYPQSNYIEKTGL